jgi:hypothetical protein
MAPRTPDDETRDRLARELYWAQEHAARATLGAGEIRDRLRELATQVRADESVTIPLGEPALATAGRGRRFFKYRLFKLARPISRRYDRLIAEQAELVTGLADQILALDADLEHLRARVEGLRDAEGRPVTTSDERPSEDAPA